MRRTRVPLALLLLLAAGVASAQCERSPTTSELSIRGFGAAYFHQVRTDSTHDRVDFYGGVCLTGEGVAWTMLAESVTVRGLSGDLSVSAQQPTLHLEGWTMTAANLHADRRELTLETVQVQGKDLSGTATSVTLDLQQGSLRLDGAALRGPTFSVRGTMATVRGNAVTVVYPRISSCTCAGSPLYDVEGSSAQIDLQGQSVVLRDGSLHAGPVTLPLGASLTLSEKALQDLSLPVKVTYLPSDAAAGITGTGLGVTVGPLHLGPGVQADIGATGLDADYPLAGLAMLTGKAGGDTFRFGKAPGGLRFDMTSDHPVLPWLDAGFDTRVLEPGNRDTLREAVLRLRAHTPVPAFRGDAGLQLLAAGSSQEPATGHVAGARVGANASLRMGTAPAPWGRVTLRATASETLYPDQGASQWGVELQPGYGVRLGPVQVDLGYLARFTDSGLPFTTTLDRLEPAQRPSLDLQAKGAWGAGWSASATFAARYDLVGSPSVGVGFNRLHVGATVAHRSGAWQLSAGVDSALEGAIAPDGQRAGYLQGSVRLTDGGLEFGARARTTWAPDPVGLDRLELSAAVPIELPGVELRPYLALNFAPTVTAGALPAISGHGLDVTLVSCCGALQLGYRDQDGTWSVSVSVDLQRRSAGSTQASGCGGGPATGTTLAVAGSGAQTCRAGATTGGGSTTAAPGSANGSASGSTSASGTGIMAGAASDASPP